MRRASVAAWLSVPYRTGRGHKTGFSETAMADEMDIVNRDPNDLNDHVKVRVCHFFQFIEGL